MKKLLLIITLALSALPSVANPRIQSWTIRQAMEWAQRLTSDADKLAKIENALIGEANNFGRITEKAALLIINAILENHYKYGMNKKISGG
ncbi:MAG: hypothetical protein Q8Q25_02055 [bacterium]|nr:hypothetical protein [bacterium]